MNNQDNASDGLALSRALREVVLEADSSSLRDTLVELEINPADLAEKGRTAAAKALQLSTLNAKPEPLNVATPDTAQLHDGLSALLQLLRRKDNLTEEELADRARVDVSEIRRIECDRSYIPSPRTVYQLEHTFKLPRRTLVKLSGLTELHSKEFTEEVLRFAAHSKAIQKITRHERKLLNEFVKFLSSYTDSHSPK
jgi:transcriptional regulator with XRE-family HTH domain